MQASTTVWMTSRIYENINEKYPSHPKVSALEQPLNVLARSTT